MSEAIPSGSIRRAFGVEERRFVLTIKAWRELEKSRNAGLGVIATRIAPMVQLLNHPGGPQAYPGGLIGAISHGLLGGFYVDDIKETLLWGLVGGGMTEIEAGILVRKQFDDAVDAAQGPAFRFASLAFDILTGALIGLPDEPIKPLGEPKAAGQAKPSRRSKTANKGSRTSTAQRGSSGSQPARPTS